MNIVVKPNASKKKEHAYSFFGGGKLAKMGAAWFVSYAYYDHIDQTHTNWHLVETKTRISMYRASISYHRYWLDRIMKMKKMETNHIGLTAKQIKQQAEEVMAEAW